MENLITWLEKQIEGCNDLGAMEKEKWAFIQTLKKVRKEQCNIDSVTPRYFYVVEKNDEEDLEQLSIGLETLEQAKTFKDSDYHKKKNPNAFIVCTFNEG